MRIISTADIGDLGSAENAEVVYRWKWYYAVPSVLLWTVLLATIALVKDNRNSRAMLILVPLFTVLVLWSILKKVLGFNTADAEMFTMLFHSLIVGITAMWLLAHKLCNRNRFMTVLLAGGVLAGAGLVGILSFGKTKFTAQTMLLPILFVVSAIAVLLIFVLTAWFCRKRYSGLRFMLWLPISSLATGVVSMVYYFVIGLVIMSFAGVGMPSYSVVLQVLVVGAVFGILLYVVNLPYVILALRSPFFRQRFYACLRLKSMPGGLANQTQTGENTQVASFCEENSQSQ